MDNCNQANLADDLKIHVLIEADIEHYHPNAFAEATKVSLHSNEFYKINNNIYIYLFLIMFVF